MLLPPTTLSSLFWLLSLNYAIYSYGHTLTIAGDAAYVFGGVQEQADGSLVHFNDMYKLDGKPARFAKRGGPDRFPQCRPTRRRGPRSRKRARVLPSARATRSVPWARACTSLVAAAERASHLWTIFSCLTLVRRPKQEIKTNKKGTFKNSLKHLGGRQGQGHHAQQAQQPFCLCGRHQDLYLWRLFGWCCRQRRPRV